MERRLLRSSKGTSEEELDPAVIEAIKCAQERTINHNLLVVHPNITLIQQMIKITENYIKEHARIVYGGTAIEAYLEAKNIFFPKEPGKYIDYDFYTPNNERDSIAIANLFQEAGMKYARRVAALHSGTLRVSAEFTKEFIADATFVPESAYNGLQTTKINDILYIGPQFLKIDLYTSVCNPHFNVFRWEKSYKRLLELEKHYPLPEEYTFAPQIVPTRTWSPKVIKTFTEYAQKNKDTIIIVGEQAYNLYNPKKPLPITYFAFYAIDPKKEAEKFNKKPYIITKYHKYLDIFPEYYELSHKDDPGIPLVRWFDISTDCISVTEIGKFKNVSNYHWLLRFFYGLYNIYYNNNLKFYYSWIIQTLIQEYNQFHEEHYLMHKRDTTNPFKIFQIDCISRPENVVKTKPGRSAYAPDKNKINPDNIETPYENNLLAEKYE